MPMLLRLSTALSSSSSAPWTASRACCSRSRSSPFALERESVYFAVDAKPKRTTDLQRLRNITANPAVSVLFDHYEEDWRKLWWVRVEGSARILGDEAEAQRAIDLLVGRYEQYRRA